jgi:hypothetical protein
MSSLAGPTTREAGESGSKAARLDDWTPAEQVPAPRRAGAITSTVVARALGGIASGLMLVGLAALVAWPEGRFLLFCTNATSLEIQQTSRSPEECLFREYGSLAELTDGEDVRCWLRRMRSRAASFVLQPDVDPTRDDHWRIAGRIWVRTSGLRPLLGPELTDRLVLPWPIVVREQWESRAPANAIE